MADNSLMSELISSQSTTVRISRYVLAGIFAIFGLLGLLMIMVLLRPPYVYGDDFVQDYAMTKAVAEGISPAAASPLLWKRFSIPNAHPESAFPSPHPPTLAVLMLPLSALDFPRAAVAWFVVSIICLVVSIYLLERIAGVQLSVRMVALILVASLGWAPLAWDLRAGQVNLVLLSLLSGMWLAFKNARPSFAGCILGFSLLIKQILWPLLVVLAIRRQWRALGFSILTVSLGYSLTLGIVGTSPFLTYFSQSLPRNTEFYGAVFHNISLWSVGWKLFDGTAN